MGTTAQKLQALLNSKSALKTAIAKFKSNIGDKLSDYAPVVSEMADRADNLWGMSINASQRNETIVIPFKEGYGTLRAYLFYDVNADHIYISSGYAQISTRQFSYLNRDATSSSQICYLHLPNSFTNFEASNMWDYSRYVVPVLENGWKATFELPGDSYTAITSSHIENMIDALADLTGQTSQAMYVTQARYNMISAEKLALATGKNWSVIAT